MSATEKTIVALKVTRAIGTAAMLGAVVAGVLGFGPEAKLVAGAGTVAAALILAKVTHFIS